MTPTNRSQDDPLHFATLPPASINSARKHPIDEFREIRRDQGRQLDCTLSPGVRNSRTSCYLS